MTKAEAESFKARWCLANDAIIEEERRTPPSVKLQQLAVMFAASEAMGWAEDLKVGEEEVRERWRRLREKLRA